MIKKSSNKNSVVYQALQPLIKKAQSEADIIGAEPPAPTTPTPPAEPAPQRPQKPDSSSSVAVGKFVQRQTPSSKFSHFEGSWDELVQIVKQNISKAKQGYRSGVWLVPVPSEGFFTSISRLSKESPLKSYYSARREGEDEFLQSVVTKGQKVPAKSVEIVLYSHDTLAEDPESIPNLTGADFEIVSINASPTEKGTPMTPMARARNILALPGGTKVDLDKMSLGELKSLIREMAEDTRFWSQHAPYEPEEPPKA